ncbi:apolipoprotein N-acyltransferase [uncultured Clostridium sp.]|uniref:apolipoprotein N-acyltransferase n=1 Tax=uncultured Clostridium sp. TaxID=59620 RepID=UPI0026718499|nr:apolipoprotein N-acyltransferase [uncultured Clostridium sp.]
MIRVLSKNKDLLLVIISSIIAGLSFTYDNLSLFMWIGLIPFLYVFINKIDNYKSGFRKGLTFGLVYYLVILRWIFDLYPITWIEMSNKDSIVLLFIGWLFISLLEGSVFGVILGFFTYIKTNNKALNVISISFLWIIIEWIQGMGILGFPWGKLAVSQVSILPIVQSVSLLGSLFIGFLIILVNGFLMIGITNIKFNRTIINKYIIIAVSIFIVNLVFGLIKININNNNNLVDISIIQGNISTEEKWSINDTKGHFKIYKDLTKEAISKSENKTKMVFWPESAVPLNITHSEWLQDEYINLAKENNVHFFTGVFHSDKEPIEKEYNSVYSINEEGEIGEKYFKRHLVPFGEVLPFKDILFKLMPSLRNINMFDGYLVSGEEAVVVDTIYGKVGTVICFESIFPSLVLDNVRIGAELIFVATNDSWFKDSEAVYQHNDNSVLRAIESNRYVVRAANTGISTVINNKGQVINMLPPLESGYINTKIQFIDKDTVYSKVGDVLVLVAFMSLGATFLMKKRNKVRTRCASEKSTSSR